MGGACQVSRLAIGRGWSPSLSPACNQVLPGPSCLDSVWIGPLQHRLLSGSSVAASEVAPKVRQGSPRLRCIPPQALSFRGPRPRASQESLWATVGPIPH